MSRYNKKMIPKVIHYCWFGKNPLTDLAIKCIESWKKYCPDYEIIQWDESNFNLDSCSYVKEAYSSKKWAFVSDYARYSILYYNGGLYFDTDVELIKPIDEILMYGPFMGMESEGINDGLQNYTFTVNPGLGIAAYPQMDFYGEILEFYENKHFIKEDGTIDRTTIVKYTTDLLMKHGMVAKSEIQKICGINIYPKEYFCPKDYFTGELNITEKSISIHHFTASWLSKKERNWYEFTRIVHRKLIIGNLLTNSLIWKLLKHLYIDGLKMTIFKVLRKIFKLKDK